MQQSEASSGHIGKRRVEDGGRDIPGTGGKRKTHTMYGQSDPTLIICIFPPEIKVGATPKGVNASNTGDHSK